MSATCVVESLEGHGYCGVAPQLCGVEVNGWRWEADYRAGLLALEEMPPRV